VYWIRGTRRRGVRARKKRATSVYLFERSSQARAFGQAEFRGEGFHVYEVTPIGEVSGPFPFALVDLVHRDLSRTGSLAGAIDEYWTPTRDWAFCEYLASAFEVVGLIGKPPVTSPDFFKVAAERTKLMQDQDLRHDFAPAAP